MRRFLTTSFITLALALSAAGAAPAAHAAIGAPCKSNLDCAIGAETCDLGTPPLQGTNKCVAASGPVQPSSPVTSPSNYVMQSSQNAAPSAPPATGAATNPNNGTIGNTAPDGFGTVMIWIMSLFAWLVGVAALTLDYAVYYTVVTMGNYLHNLTAIGVAWRIMRDVGNIMLIFGFLAIGISIIVNADWYGGGTKFLPKLLIVAVLLNFSLFMSEAVVDVGNLVATQFYTQINGDNTPTTQTLSATTVGTPGLGAGALGNEGISNAIMAQIGLQTIYNAGHVNTEIFKAGNTWIIGFMAVILFMITAFVMFSLAFILIARFVFLVYLIIVSPFRVVGFGIPVLEKASGKWLSDLLHQTFIAPVLLLLLYVALAIITDAHFLTGLCTSTDPTNPTCIPDWKGYVSGNFQGFASMLLSFFIAMGLLLYITFKAKDLGAVGASWATRMGGRLSFGAVSLGGRATLGMTGNLLASKRMQSWAKKGGVRGLALKGLVLGGKGLRSATYDFRNAPGAAAGLGKIGINAGEGATLTAKQAHEAQYGWKPTKEWLRESAKERDKSAQYLDRESILASGIPAAVQKELKKMSDDELAELKGIREGQSRLVQALRPTAYDSLMKNKNLLDSEKSAIKTSWENQFSTHATSAAALGRMTEDERVALGGKTLAKPEVYESLSADDFDNIRSAKLQPAEKATIAAYVRGIHSGAIPVPPSASPTLQADIIAAAANPKFKAYYSI